MTSGRQPKYPFVPKSTAYMVEGQYWDIPLTSGSYACGRVLQFDIRAGRRHSRAFLAGLLDWSSPEPPSDQSIAGAKLLEQGDVHIMTIRESRGQIRGWRPLHLDHIQPFLELSHSPSHNCMLVRGFETLRPATLDEQKALYVHSTWGFGVIRLLAEAYFVQQKPPVRRLPWDVHLELRKHMESS